MTAIEEMLGISIAEILSFAIAGTTLIVVMLIWNSGLIKTPINNRLKALEGRRDALRSSLITTKQRSNTVKKVDNFGFMRQIADKLKLLQHEQIKKIGLQLQQAGFRSKDAIVIYQFSRLVLPALFGLGGVIAFFGLHMMPEYATYYPLMSIGLVLLGFKTPDIYIYNTKQKRTDALRKGLPDGIDLLVVCAEAGLTLDAALHRVAKELVKATPELSEELALTSIELGFLPDRRQALMNLSDRVDLPALRGVVTTLVQSEKYGTPLAASLRVLSAEFRNERLLQAEEKAAKLPATMTVPLILFILPALFVVLLGPAACKLTDGFIDR